MRTFFEDLGRKIGETAETMTNKAGEAMEIQRLRSQIKTLERSSEADYAELGRMVYDKYEAGEELDGQASCICESIRSREVSIAKYEEQIFKVKGDVKCEGCGKSVEREMTYCPYCGEKVPKTQASEKTDYAGAVKDKVVDMAEKVREKAGNAAETVREMAGQAAESAKDKTEEAAEKAAQAAEDRSEDGAEAFKEKAGSTAEAFKEKAEDTAETLKEKAEDTAETLKEKAGDTAEAFREKAVNTAEAVKEKAKDMEDKIRTMTEE